ncbi:hypothetical protein D3P96_03075 [Weissella viridescens]|uniref:Uncharacterized protein n=1 Tax=Weissella viridescens TaxID=1629 RepID=A0A3P2RG76_WEIVI|nr:hypothetical protein [Weissella viridescens]RRG18281.1 hypothetical protein D3P96_03075 [Weissella viridescens]
MKIFIIGATVVVILILLTVFRRTGRKLTERQIIESQQLVNAAMNSVVQELDPSLGIIEDSKPFRSTLVANIWGHEVMAFEFILPVERKVNTDMLRRKLNNGLQAYAKIHQLEPYDQAEPVFVVTDLWFNQAGNSLHVDVAHVVNAETVAYLHDLRRLNQSN